MSKIYTVTVSYRVTGADSECDASAAVTPNHGFGVNTECIEENIEENGISCDECEEDCTSEYLELDGKDLCHECAKNEVTTELTVDFCATCCKETVVVEIRGENHHDICSMCGKGV